MRAGWKEGRLRCIATVLGSGAPRDCRALVLIGTNSAMASMGSVGGAPAAPEALPDYNEDDDISRGLPCVHCEDGGAAQYTSWMKLHDHVRHSHGKTDVDLGGTVLLKRYKAEKTAYANRRGPR